MNTLALYRDLGGRVMGIFRWDLQLHFFWGFVLTLLGEYWSPLYSSGIIVTIVKEALDYWSKNEWSWGDFWCGMAGCALAFVHVSQVAL